MKFLTRDASPTDMVKLLHCVQAVILAGLNVATSLFIKPGRRLGIKPQAVLPVP